MNMERGHVLSVRNGQVKPGPSDPPAVSFNAVLKAALKTPTDRRMRARWEGLGPGSPSGNWRTRLESWTLRACGNWYDMLDGILQPQEMRGQGTKYVLKPLATAFRVPSKRRGAVNEGRCCPRATGSSWWLSGARCPNVPNVVQSLVAHHHGDIHVLRQRTRVQDEVVRLNDRRRDLRTSPQRETGLGRRAPPRTSGAPGPTRDR